MNAKDLRIEPPRRWSEQLDGIAWLPRFIDKTRAAHAGTLGAYLFGQSPVDRACLRALRIGYVDFARIVADAPDDAGVLAALAARDPASLDRVRAWSETLATEHRLFMFVLDVDDGYAGAGWRALKPLVNVAANTLTWTLKRIWPSRAIEAANER